MDFQPFDRVEVRKSVPGCTGDEVAQIRGTCCDFHDRQALKRCTVGLEQRDLLPDTDDTREMVAAYMKARALVEADQWRP